MSIYSPQESVGICHAAVALGYKNPVPDVIPIDSARVERMRKALERWLAFITNPDTPPEQVRFLELKWVK